MLIARRILFVVFPLLVFAACTHATPIGATPRTPVPSPSSAEDVARDFVQALGETRYVSAAVYLAPALRATVTDATLRAQWDALATRFGKFTGLGTVTSAESSGSRRVSVQALFASGTSTLVLTVDPSQQITVLDIPAVPTQANPTSS